MCDNLGFDSHLTMQCGIARVCLPIANLLWKVLLPILEFPNTAVFHFINWRIAFRICCSKTVDKSEFQSLFRTPSPATSTCQKPCTTAGSHFPHSIFPGFFVAWCRPAHGSANHPKPGRRLLNETVSVSQPPMLNCWLVIAITSFDDLSFG